MANGFLIGHSTASIISGSKQFEKPMSWRAHTCADTQWSIMRKKQAFPRINRSFLYDWARYDNLSAITTSHDHLSLPSSSVHVFETDGRMPALLAMTLDRKKDVQ